MSVISTSVLDLIMICITIHFGRNPKKGGSPPRDRRFVEIRNLNGFGELCDES